MKEFFALIKSAIKAVMDWMRTDGLLHVLVSFFIMVMVSAAFNVFMASAPVVVLVPACITLIIGGLKEAYDYIHPESHTAELHDLYCDLIGIAFGLIAVACLV